MKNIRFFLSENFPFFLFVKCSIYLNMRVFVMVAGEEEAGCFAFHCVLSVLVCGLFTVCLRLWLVYLWLVYCLSWFVACVLSVLVCGLCTVCLSLWLVYCLS